jgi:hypothetical protein
MWDDDDEDEPTKPRTHRQIVTKVVFTRLWGPSPALCSLTPWCAPAIGSRL